METIALQYKRHITSFVTYREQLTMLIQEFNGMMITHKHHTSQSILFALILSKYPGKKVILVTHHKDMDRKCMIFADEKEVDTTAYVQRCLEQENVSLVDLN